MQKENKIRVLQIGCENFGKGGRSVAIYNLMQTLQKQVEADYLSSNEIENPFYEKQISEMHGEIVHIGKQRDGENKVLYEYRRMCELITLMKRGNYDVVHINADHSWEAAKSIFSAKRSNINKIVVHAHTSNITFANHSIIKKMLLYFSRKYVNANTSVKLACSKNAALCLFGKANDVKIIKNGINTKKYKYNENLRRTVRLDNQLSDEQFLVGFVGRLAEVKNIFFAIDVFASIYNRNKNARMWIVGDGELKDSLKEYTKAKKLSKEVSFLGARSDVNQLLQAMDVLLLPSLWEGLPLITVEAQTSGLLVCASTGVPQAAIITPKMHRLPLEEGTDKWADYILESVPYERGNNDCAKVVAAEFDSETAAESLLEVYQER